MITTLGCILLLAIPYILADAFTRDEKLIDISAHGLRRVFRAFPIVGFQVVIANFFQSIGIAWKAIFLSLSRQVLFLLPMILILPRSFELNGALIALPIADTIACVLALLILVSPLQIFNLV